MGPKTHSYNQGGKSVVFNLSICGDWHQSGRQIWQANVADKYANCLESQRVW